MNNQDEFDTLFDLEEVQASATFQHQINRKINRRVYKKSIMMMICVLVITCVGYFGLSMGLNILFYNPYHEDNITKQDAEGMGFHLLLSDFVDLFYPGMSYIGHPDQDTKEGFSKYVMRGQFDNKFDSLYVGKNISDIQVQYSDLSMKEMIPYDANQFYDQDGVEQKSSYTQYDSKEEMIQKLIKMPESSVIDLSFTFDQKMDIEEFLQFKKQFRASNFIYMASFVRGGAFSIGFSSYFTTGYGQDKTSKKHYPSLEKIEAETSGDYETHYLSMLKLMINHEQFFNMMSEASLNQSMSINLIKEEYQKVKKQGLSLVGTRVYASRDDAISLLKDVRVLYPQIFDAKFSEYESNR